MYLSELFLQTVNNNFTKDNINSAMNACEGEWKKRKKNMRRKNPDACDMAEVFTILESEYSEEILAFWDVAKEFFSAENSKLEIVQVACCVSKICRNENCINAGRRRMDGKNVGETL